MTPGDIRDLANRVQYYPADARHVLHALADMVEAAKYRQEYALAVTMQDKAVDQALAKLEAIAP